jgi:hypothetical protein
VLVFDIPIYDEHISLLPTGVCCTYPNKYVYIIDESGCLILTHFTGQNHPTITNPEQGLMVLSRFAADFEHPSPHEGYHRILYVKPEDTRLNYTSADIAAILQCVHDAPPVDSSGIPSTARQRVGLNPERRGNVNRGYRGRRGGYNPQYAQGRGGLNTPSQYVVHDRLDTSRGRGLNTWGVTSGHDGSISENSGTSSEIGGQGSGSRQDPFVVD